MSESTPVDSSPETGPRVPEYRSPANAELRATMDAHLKNDPGLQAVTMADISSEDRQLLIQFFRGRLAFQEIEARKAATGASANAAQRALYDYLETKSREAFDRR